MGWVSEMEPQEGKLDLVGGERVCHIQHGYVDCHCAVEVRRRYCYRYWSRRVPRYWVIAPSRSLLLILRWYFLGRDPVAREWKTFDRFQVRA